MPDREHNHKRSCRRLLFLRVDPYAFCSFRMLKSSVSESFSCDGFIDSEIVCQTFCCDGFSVVEGGECDSGFLNGFGFFLCSGLFSDPGTFFTGKWRSDGEFSGRAGVAEEGFDLVPGEMQGITEKGMAVRERGEFAEDSPDSPSGHGAGCVEFVCVDAIGVRIEFSSATDESFEAFRVFHFDFFPPPAVDGIEKSLETADLEMIADLFAALFVDFEFDQIDECIGVSSEDA